MDELIAFLRAQLDDDERKIVAMEREETRVRTAPIFQSHPLGWLDGVDIFVSSKRWRAEVEAKRRVLDRHTPDRERPSPLGTLCRYCSPWDAQVRWPCPDVIDLAQPYVGRLGWREKWSIEP